MPGLSYSRKTIYFFATIMSLLLSYWSQMQAVLINPDGICYLQSAELMSAGLSAAMHLCDQAHWPFYSLLIFVTAKFTTLSLLSSAYLLNAIFSLITVLAFIAIVQQLQGSTRVMWCAALVILLAPGLNGLRESIIRDHGFWAGYLLAILFLLRYLHQPRWCYALLTNASLILATLFRVEGLFFLFLLPFLAGLRPILKFHLLTGLAIVFMGAWVMIHPDVNLERLTEVKLQFTSGLSHIQQNFQAAVSGLTEHVLNHYAAQHASLILFLSLFFFYLITVVSNISLIYLALIIYAWWHKVPRLTKSSQIVLWSCIAINLIVTAVFFCRKYVSL